jgi:hypothetical protein
MIVQDLVFNMPPMGTDAGGGRGCILCIHVYIYPSASTPSVSVDSADPSSEDMGALLPASHTGILTLF